MNRFDVVSKFLNSMWTAPIVMIIISILLWNEIGIAGLIGMLFVLTVVPIQG